MHDKRLEKRFWQTVVIGFLAILGGLPLSYLPYLPPVIRIVGGFFCLIFLLTLPYLVYLKVTDYVSYKWGRVKTSIDSPDS